MFTFRKRSGEGAPVPSKPGWWQRLKSGLSRTRASLTSGLAEWVGARKKIDDEVLDVLETALLTADVGVEATQEIIDDLTRRVARQQLGNVDDLMKALREELIGLLRPCEQPLGDSGQRPFVIMMVGVNGAGKTTTIGKLANKLRQQGQTVLLAAADTFRAAAVEQLQAWGERNGVDVVAQGRHADPASVVYDAIEAARARQIDVVIVDTAGRLHTQKNLMDELRKIKRVAAKSDPSAPHEVMLVVDAGIGQNALNQAAQFNEAVGLTGITVTKLDGTAKGGIVFAMAKKMGIPIRFIGVGESVDDLRTFDAAEFVDALLGLDGNPP